MVCGGIRKTCGEGGGRGMEGGVSSSPSFTSSFCLLFGLCLVTGREAEDDKG